MNNLASNYVYSDFFIRLKPEIELGFPPGCGVNKETTEIASVLPGGCLPEDPFGSIVGGKINIDVPITDSSGHFPWMVSIGLRSEAGSWEHQCGGSLISASHVMTAAHCIVFPR